ncbi:MAG: redoxin domain-containing protein [Planctomycetales bacterium]
MIKDRSSRLPATHALTGWWIAAHLGLAAFCWAGLVPQLVAAPPSEPVPANATPDLRLGLSLIDLKGQAHRIGGHRPQAATIVVFLSTECPIARGYITELNRLAAAFAGDSSRAVLLGAICDATVTRRDAARFAEEFQIAFPVLFDGSGELAATLRPTHVPEAFVLDRRDTVVYRGRIDDAYAGLGQRRSKVEHHDLEVAVRAVFNDVPVATPQTTPVGCQFESRGAAAEPAKVTYTRDIAPLLAAHCMNCHREGEVAPFPLTDYRHAAKRAGQLAEVTGSRFMPPWKPKPDFGHFRDERRLTPAEQRLFQAWAEAGAPEGDAADLPPPPKFAEGWLLGEPDLVIRMPEAFDVPADGPDVFRNFVIPLPVESDQLVRAVEFRPGNRRIVHHAIFYLDNRGEARKLDTESPGLGYGTFGGPGFLPSGALGGWAPGGTPQALPDGMGRMLRKNSDLVMQVHYHPSGKPESDQSTVGIHYLKRQSQQVVAGLMVLDRSLNIPAGEPRHRMHRDYVLPSDATLVGVTPHMHLLGREMKVTATAPDGRVEPLIHITDWNFNWQDQYLFAEPLRLSKGTRLEVEGWFDNSSANPLNPHTPPQRVTWGEQTTDEMFICFFLMTTDKPQDLRSLIIDNLTAISGGQVARSLQKLLNRSP